MRTTSSIRNKKALEWGLSLQEAYLFSWVYELSSWANSVIIGSDTYYFCTKSKIIEELPLLSDKTDTIYRHMKSLSSKGLIKIKKIDNRDYIMLTHLAKTWNQYVDESERSEKNPSEVGNKSEFSSEKNPTDNIIQYNNNTNDKQIFFNKNIQDSEVFNFFKETFTNLYLQENKTSYIWEKKDFAHIYPLIKKIVLKMDEEQGETEYTKEQVKNTILYFLTAIWKVRDMYFLQTVEVGIIRSKFNEIFLRIKSGKNGNQPQQSTAVRNEQRARQIADELRQKYGSCL